MTMRSATALWLHRQLNSLSTSRQGALLCSFLTPRQVYSVSMFKRHTLEGCGYLTVPDSCSGGSHNSSPGDTVTKDVSTWKPVGDHLAMLTDFYLGGGVHLSDMSCIGVCLSAPPLHPSRDSQIPNSHASGLSKFGVRTQSSGLLSLPPSPTSRGDDIFPGTVRFKLSVVDAVQSTPREDSLSGGGKHTSVGLAPPPPSLFLLLTIRRTADR
jgi:hypothetical protein